MPSSSRLCFSATLLTLLFPLTHSFAQLTSEGSQLWRQGESGIEGGAERGDVFGFDVAAGDFNGDGFADLAAGVPGEDNEGAVSIILGGSNGLVSAGNQRWKQGGDLEGDSEGNDFFGFAVATEDFNRDGFDDLAIGVPGENTSRGAANVIFGGPEGLNPGGNQLWRQGDDGIEGDDDMGDAFGSALATGDFNGDTFADLAVGVPGEDSSSGTVNVLFGSQGGGLISAGNQRWSQGGDILGGKENGDSFGSALTVGDFNGDGFDDLAVGVPGEDDGRGTVNVIFGSGGGLTSNGNQRWDHGEMGLFGERNGGDVFGFALASGDFDNDGFDDLAVGVPGDDDNRGAVNVIYGSAGGLTAQGNQRWQRGGGGIAGPAGDEDEFGIEVTTGDFDGDGFDDLVIGVPGEDSPGGGGDPGSINVLYGSAAGLSVDGDQRWARGEMGVSGEKDGDDRFGSVLGAGDFGRDGAADLAIGVPSDNDNRGAATVLYGEISTLPTISAVVGAGLSLPSVERLSRNALASIFGLNFAPEGTQRQVRPADLVNGRIPTSLGRVCVEVDGRRAPLFAVFPRQINFQAPQIPDEGMVAVSVLVNCDQGNQVRSNAVDVSTARATPEFFFFALNEDGVNPIIARNFTRGTLVGAPGLLPGATFEPARPGDVVVAFLTGLGPTSPSALPGELPQSAAPAVETVALEVDGVPVAPSYAGVAPGFAGLYQINFEIPLASGAANVPVIVRVGDGAQAVVTPAGGFLAVQP